MKSVIMYLNQVWQQQRCLLEIVALHVIAAFTEWMPSRAQWLELLKTSKYGNIWKKFIFEEDDLALASNNISNRDTKILSSSSHNGQSVHNSMAMKIDVRSRLLWDSPRKYIWKYGTSKICGGTNLFWNLEQVHEITKFAFQILIKTRLIT